MFRKIAFLLDIETLQIKDVKRARKMKLPSILRSGQPDFSKYPWLPDHPDVRIMHVIRDPRDVVVSGMHYHRTCREIWALTPIDRYGGLTYQQTINALPDDHSRYLFEMGGYARGTIRAMRKWDYKKKNVTECRYEDLIEDAEAELFGKIVAELGFEEREIGLCKKVFTENLVFGDRGQRLLERPHIGSHVRSGRTGQWKEVFDDVLAAEFLKRFGNVLIDLGYEPDHSWCKRVPRNGNEAARRAYKRLTATSNSTHEEPVVDFGI